MLKASKVLLFFIASAAPSPAELKAASEIDGYSVRFRNASLIGKDDKPEKCHAVAGQVPAQYLALDSVKHVELDELENEDVVSLGRKTIKQLTELLEENNVETPTGLNKAQLIELAVANKLGEA